MQKFGVMGKSLPHTYSPLLHKLLGFEPTYEVIERDETQVSSLISSKEFTGFNVTVPYKKTVAKLCDELSSAASATGSVNTVIIDESGRAYGDNTDVHGFGIMLKLAGIQVKDKTCLILGTGGAAYAIEYYLKLAGAAEILFCSRKGPIDYSNFATKAKQTQVVINATPVGMYPKVDESPIDLCKLPKLEAAVDIVYNPAQTRFLEQAEKLGLKKANGLSMLVAQAFLAERVFRKETKEDYSVSDKELELISKVTQQLRAHTINITLIGMPGCGKTTITSMLSERLSREAIDLDSQYEREYGITPAIQIEKDGEDCFRERETEIGKRFLPMSGKIFSCGGGIVTRSVNDFFIKCNSLVVYLDRPIETLSDENRPITKLHGAEQLKAERQPLYEAIADIKITSDSADTQETTLDKLMLELRKRGFEL